MGSSMAVVARLDVSSVRKFTAATKIKIRSNKASPSMEVKCIAIHSANPVVEKPFANANPPPNKRMIPHGSSLQSSQFNRGSLLVEGMIKSKVPAANAIMVSSIKGRKY